MFPTTELTASGHRIIVITDQLAAPADFLLHQIVTSYLKDRRNNNNEQNRRHRRCILLSTSSDLSRYKAVSAKQYVTIDQHIKSRTFKFVDLVSHLRPPQQSESSTTHQSLHSLFDLIKDYIDDNTNSNSDTPPDNLVIFDDTSSLVWLGHSIIDSTRFIRALSSLCRKSNSTLIFRHHNLNPEIPDNLLLHLLHTTSYHVEVTPLSSGKSGAVSGEVSLHPGPTLGGGHSSIPLIPRNQALQYRLADYGAVFFDKGIGGGVL